MSNILIVESENDQYFAEAVIDHLKYRDIRINPPIIDHFETMRGLDHHKLVGALLTAKRESLKGTGPRKIGIMIDLDNRGVQDRLSLVNQAVLEALKPTEQIESIGQFINVDLDKKKHAKVGCYFTNVDGKGDLETVLRRIKSKESLQADCLDSWRECIGPEAISDKNFDKLWVQFYQRWDCCKGRDRNQAARKCDNKASMNKGIYDYDHEILTGMRAFLKYMDKND